MTNYICVYDDTLCETGDPLILMIDYREQPAQVQLNITGQDLINILIPLTTLTFRSRSKLLSNLCYATHIPLIVAEGYKKQYYYLGAWLYLTSFIYFFLFEVGIAVAITKFKQTEILTLCLSRKISII